MYQIFDKINYKIYLVVSNTLCTFGISNHNNMAKQTLIDTDESRDGSMVFFYAKSGQSYEAHRSDILQFIEEHEMNTYTGGPGLTSDPYEREETVIQDAESYYADNFEEVNEQYFKLVINK